MLLRQTTKDILTFYLYKHFKEGKLKQIYIPRNALIENNSEVFPQQFWKESRNSNRSANTQHLCLN